jgi:hypothetical protein
MLSSFLAKQFHSYLATEGGREDCRKCLDVKSVWKKPAHFSFEAYYSKSTNQIIWMGYVNPYMREGYDVFTLFDEGDCITVGDLLINMIQVIDVPGDLVLEDKESKELLEMLLVDLGMGKEVLVNN